MNVPRVGLDIDGVLADFMAGMIYQAKARGMIVPERSAWITGWSGFPGFDEVFREVMGDSTFWLELPAYADALNSKDFEVAAYITARPIDGAVTHAWLMKHGFPNAAVITVGGDSKLDAIKSHNIGVYVEDRPENFDEINDAGTVCFLMDRPWNRLHPDHGLRIKTLTIMRKYLDSIASEHEAT